MASHSKIFICPYCDTVLNTSQGLKPHIAQKISCNQALQKSFKAITILNPELASTQLKNSVDTTTTFNNKTLSEDDEPTHTSSPLLPLQRLLALQKRPKAYEKPASKCTQVEEFLKDSEEAGGLPKNPFIDWEPGLRVKILEKGRTVFEIMHDNAKAHSNGDKPWTPFVNAKEWKLAQFLASLD
jgi:hypothetical protein